MIRLYFKENEIIFLKTICKLLENNIDKNNLRNEQKVNVNAFTIAKKSGISYDTVRKNIRKIMEL